MQHYSNTQSQVKYALLILLIAAAIVILNSQQTLAQQLDPMIGQNPQSENGAPDRYSDNQETAPSKRAILLTLDEWELVAFINQERSHTGLAKLEVDPVLVGIAREKSWDMVRFNYFGHISERLGSVYDQLAKAGFDNRIAAENLAGSPDYRKAGLEMLRSPAHRCNILNPRFTRIGVGVVKGGPYGRMITEVFVE